MQDLNALEEYFAKCPSRLFGKNSVVFGARQEAPGLFHIISGKVKMSTIRKGREHTLFVLGPGDSFPLGPYFLNDPQEMTYTALTDVRAAWRPRAEVDKFLARHPAAMRDIVNYLINAFYGRVTTLSLGSADERVLHQLIELSERFSEGTDDMIELEITQQELADSVNLSRESTSLILNRLANSGILELYRNKIAVSLDRAKVLMAES